MRQLQVAAEKCSAKHPERPVQLDLRFHPYQLGGGGRFTETPISRAEYSEGKYGVERTHGFNRMFDQKYKEVGLDGL